LQQEAVPVTQACRLLQISRAGYYQHWRRGTQAADIVTTVPLKPVFTASGSTYGSRRLVTALQAQGLAIGRYRVRRLMREESCQPLFKDINK
jgi:hypothetical protein